MINQISDDDYDKDPTYHISDISGSSEDTLLETNNNEILLSVHNISTNHVKKQKVKPSRDIKKNSCFYCKKLYSRLPEHLEMKHKNEEEVKLFSSMPKS